MRTLSLCFLLIASSSTIASAETERDHFESRVRPLLVERCVTCHGDEKQESGLRLDSRDGWMAGGSRGSLIDPGNPTASLLIRAVSYTDPELKMPPDGKLSTREVSDLEEWIARGAFDPRRADAESLASTQMSLDEARGFWSFQPVTSPQVPVVDGDDSHNPIDAFIHVKRVEHGLDSVGLADKRILIRRVTFDVTGLPPTPNEIRNFLDDDSPEAFATLVERLLHSKAYGERQGRHWLDVARYADTAGDGADYPVREARKYRDWVIDAFNDDKPYDEFVREQIAGDILALKTLGDAGAANDFSEYAELVSATGFLAIGKRYGYQPSPAFQHLDFADVIDSVGRSLLALSLGCARCHDHKYDPVSMADYYGIYGILASTQWPFPGGEGHQRPAHFAKLVPPSEVARREKDQTDELARLDARLDDLQSRATELDPRRRAGGTDLDIEGQEIGKPLASPWYCAGPIEVREDAQSPFAHVHPRGTRGVRIGSAATGDGIRYVFKEGLRATPGKKMHFTVDFRPVAASPENPTPGAFRFYLGRGVVQSLAVEFSATATEFAVRNGSSWETIRSLTPGTWYTLRVTIDPATKKYAGIVGAPGDITVFEEKGVGPSWDGVADCFICDAEGHVEGAPSARDIDNVGLQDTAFGELGTGPVLRPIPPPDAEERLRETDAEIERLTKERKALAETPLYEVAYAVSEAKPGDARIQLRGNPKRLGDEVPRRFLEVLGSDTLADGSSSSGRLELARWITRPSNPLTARVFVNRVWQWHFGRGLVATPSDFGPRGEPPTHPELLDWLTADFIASGWSVKALHRRILSSRTYQLAQATNDDEKSLERDPDNRWYWRFSRRALDAESIRDAMLAVSGLLDRSAPKPHPFPPVHTWRFTIHHPFHAVYDSNHRSLYLMVQRNRRHPYLQLFDSADPNLSIATRQPTTTPSQALFLMNSPFVHAQADGFARRVIERTSVTEARVRLAFESAHGQEPTEGELRETIRFLESYRTRLSSEENETANKHEAWSALARVLLTSNAFLYLD